MIVQKPSENVSFDKDRFLSVIKEAGADLSDAGKKALEAYKGPPSEAQIIDITKQSVDKLEQETKAHMKDLDIKDFLSKFPIPDQEALIKRLEQNGITIPNSIKADIAKIVASGKKQIEGVAGEVQDVVQTARGVVDSSALKNLTPEQIAQKAQKVQDSLDGKGGTLSAAKDVVDLAGGGMKGLVMGGVFLVSAILRYFGLDFGKGILSDLGIGGVLDASKGKFAKKAGEVSQDTVEGGKTVIEKLAKMDREKILTEMTPKFAKSIEDKYFGGGKLSDDQMKKLRNILQESFSDEELQKFIKNLQDGKINVGNMADTVIELAKSPVKLTFSLALSGIIPYKDIAYHAVVLPGKTLIQLTLNGLGIYEMPMNEWNYLLSEKDKQKDSHALDLARVELYRVNGLLWNALGSIFSGSAAGLIMMTDTVSGANGIHMANSIMKGDYKTLIDDFAKIEKMLGSPVQNGGTLNTLLNEMRGIEHNNQLIKIMVDSKGDQKAFIAIAQAMGEPLRSELFPNNSLKILAQANPEDFAIKSQELLRKPNNIGSTSISQTIKTGTGQFFGTKDGLIQTYMERTNHMKEMQVKLFTEKGAFQTITKIKTALAALTMARSADTVVLHLNDAKDISKFRALLSVIPGGFKGLGNILPAGSFILSLGSILADETYKKDGKLPEEIKSLIIGTLVPVYGAYSVIRSKTINIQAMIEKGEMPAFGDVALTGAIGAVGLFEVGRVVGGVSTGVAQIRGGDIGKGTATILRTPFMHIEDLGKSLGYVSRGVSHLATASKPIYSETYGTIAKIASKIPKKGKVGIIASGILLGGGAAYAYTMDSDPKDVYDKMKKEGVIGDDERITSKGLQGFLDKSAEEKKVVLDTLLALGMQNMEGVKTSYDQKSNEFVIIIPAKLAESDAWTKINQSGIYQTFVQLGVKVSAVKSKE